MSRGCPRLLPASAWRGAGTADRLSCKAERGTKAATSQPTREQFVAKRGQTSKPPSVLGFPGHHFNAITSWEVSPKGEVRHVYA